ncbi:MAG: MFS transporter [Paludibacter sp.]|nr:MFS transporter [Paludibacter sp.]
MKLKFPTLFSLYIAQSIPMSFFSTVVPVIMRQEQYSLESIGLLQLVKLPWIFKFLWAPLVDNHANNRKQIRRWIILSELFYAGVILSISLFSLQTDFTLIVVLMILAFIASATQDIATDIFAIRILRPEEKAVGNGIQSGGSFIGSLFGTGVLLLAYHYLGWQYLLWILAAFVIFAIVPLYVYRPGSDLSVEKKRRVNLTDIFSFFKEKLARKRLLVLIFYYSGLIGILAMLKPYMVDLGYNVKEIGFMSGIVGTAVAAIAALLGGYIVKFIGRKTAAYVFALLNLSVGVFFYLISMHTPSLFELYAGICLLWGAYGLSTVVIYTTSMDAVRPSSAGTDFTVQIVVTHLSSMLIAVFSGKVGDLVGYHSLFGIEALFSLCSVLILFYVYPVKLKYGNR